MLKTAMTFLAGALVMAATLGGVLALSGGDAEVRIGARQLDDGRVEVAVQQRGDDGWSETQLPSARFLRTDPQPGRWYWSDGVAIATTAADHAVVAPTPEQELFCLVTHEGPGDEAFWSVVRAMAHRWQIYHPQIRVEVMGAPDPADQAALVRQCIADGATAIGATLAAPAAMKAALLEARAAGISVASFNSGVEDFAEVGSIRHVGVDETSAGMEAGARFLEAGVSGVILCVIHEAQNTGLEERCNGLELGYGGDVERLRVHPTGVSDIPGTTVAIATRLRAENGEPAISAVLTLNTEIGLAAHDAISEVGSDAPLATFDQTFAVLEAIRDGEILFGIDTVQAGQAWYALSSMLYGARSEPRLKQLYGLDDPLVVLGQIPVRIGVRLFTVDNAEAWLNAIRAGQAGLVETELDDN